MLTDLADFDGHEMVAFVTDPRSGLRAIIAIHNTALGPAHGGTRGWAYATEQEATTDALRLSRAMTYKNAVAGLPLGGGKSVILLNPGSRPGHDALCAFGDAVERLGGAYLPAEDVGIGPDEVHIIATRTSHVLGVGEGPDTTSAAEADPSPMTALGVVSGIREMLRRETGSAALDGRRFAVQGLGGVGASVAKLLAPEGGKLIVSDLDDERCRHAEKDLAASVVSPDAIHRSEADVFIPCALGAVLNARTIPELGARIVCGGANNQLEDAKAGEALAAAGIAYAPDFVVNAGGVMWTSAPITGLSRTEVTAKVDAIGEKLGKILDRRAPDQSAQDAAEDFAREIIAAACAQFE